MNLLEKDKNILEMSVEVIDVDVYMQVLFECLCLSFYK